MLSLFMCCLIHHIHFIPVHLRWLMLDCSSQSCPNVRCEVYTCVICRQAVPRVRCWQKTISWLDGENISSGMHVVIVHSEPWWGRWLEILYLHMSVWFYNNGVSKTSTFQNTNNTTTATATAFSFLPAFFTTVTSNYARYPIREHLWINWSYFGSFKALPIAFFPIWAPWL